jgi:nitrate/nitrite transporter NarK
MDPRTEAPSATDLAGEAGGLLGGLGLITIALFPFAVPVLILVIGPLAVLALAGLVLALPILVPVWLFRVLRSRLRGRPQRQPVRRQAPSRSATEGAS